MDLFFLGSVLGWTALVVSLLAAATLSIVAFLRPRTALVWFAAGALGIALAAAASVPPPEPASGATLLVVLAIAVAVFGGSPAATTALDLAMGASSVPGVHGGILVDAPATRGEARAGVAADAAPREVLRGGITIGVLERLATAGAIVAGFPEALAIVVAVKGVGRFTELEAPEARERFIIGTFASIIWAAAAGLVVHLALR